MKYNLIVVCVIVLFSCHSKKNDPNPNAAGPWVKSSVSLDQGVSYMTSVRDTLVLGCNVTISESTHGDYYSGTINSNGYAFYGHSAPFYNPITMLFVYKEGIYTCSFGDGIYYSNDFCNTWELKKNGLSGIIDVFEFAGTDNALYICGNKIYTSIDKGDNWANITIPNMQLSYAITAIDNTLLASARVGSSTDYVLYKSEDNGANWDISNPVGMSGTGVFKLDAINNVLYASTPDGVYVSTDEGTNWIKAKGLDVSGGINTTRSFTSDKGIVYAATTLGVFKSKDNGLNWSNTGCNDVYSLEVIRDTIYANNADGIWMARVTAL